MDELVSIVDPLALKAINEGKSPFDLHMERIQEVGDKVLFHRAQDMNPYLLDNKEDRKNSAEDWARGHDMKRVASVPIGMWEFLESCGIAGDEKELAKFLDRNPEYKTVEKHLS